MLGKRASVLWLVAVAVIGALGALAWAGDGRVRADAPVGAVATGPILGAELDVSWPMAPDPIRHNPQVAYNPSHGEYLVVWDNFWPSGNQDVYARRVSASGQLLSWFSVASGPGERRFPALAYNEASDEYLVVWTRLPAIAGAQHEIWGRLVAWDGSTMGPEFPITTFPLPYGVLAPQVAWNSRINQYLVVWSGRDHSDPTLPGPPELGFALLGANGLRLRTVVLAGEGYADQPAVTYNHGADEYLLVWRRMVTPTNTDIAAIRITGESGDVVPPGRIEVSVAAEFESNPAVATNRDHRYLVVWQFASGANGWDILGQELDGHGVRVGGAVALAATGQPEVDPAVAARGGPARDYIITWAQLDGSGHGQVLARHWGAALHPPFPIPVRSYWNNDRPAVAWGHSGALVVFEGQLQSGASRHIYGRLWTPQALFLPLVVR